MENTLTIDRDEITAAVTRYVSEAFNLRNQVPFNETTQLMEEGVIDSTGLLEIISAIEEDYEFEVPDEDLATSFFSVKSIVDYIINKLKSK